MPIEVAEISNQTSEQEPETKSWLLLQAGRYLAHLAIVYVLVNTGTQWLAGQIHGTILPMLQQHPPTTSGFEFLFSHLQVFSFVPAFLIAFLAAQVFRHSAAYFVWVVPATILIYKMIVFQPVSVMAPHWTAAFFQYFGGGFHIEEFHNWKQLFELAVTNPDMTRGMEQLHFTAPFYAAVGYSVGAFLSSSLHLPWLQKAVRELQPRFLGLK